MKLIFFTCFLFINSGQVLCQSLPAAAKRTGKVIKIVDGDTFDLLTKEKKTLRVRMNGIDCPERKQDFYRSAKNALASFIFNKEVQLSVTGRDRNKRIIAIVYRHGKDINLAMIENGYAWHYKKYSTNATYAKAEQQARTERKGLWSLDHPVAPWDFRKKSPGVFKFTLLAERPVIVTSRAFFIMTCYKLMIFFNAASFLLILYPSPGLHTMIFSWQQTAYSPFHSNSG